VKTKTVKKSNWT